MAGAEFRRLILMRHAKSDWKAGAPTDHARPLNKRGRRDAPRMARELRSRGWWPDRVLSSDSERTRQTWARMAREEGEVPVDFRSGLYLGGTEEIQSALKSEDGGPNAGANTVLVLGHNPGWEDALGWLSGVDETLTTANTALLTAPWASWSDLVARPGAFELLIVLRPRELAP